jgi:regulator of cell morphogenesis and NO signaling
MNLNSAKTVRELAVEIPNATRIFEKFGIDYCCGGKKPLDEACRAANLPIHDVIEALETAASPTESPSYNQISGSLAELVDHIVKTHHKFTREEISRLQKLLAKVCSVHGQNHPELIAI